MLIEPKHQGQTAEKSSVQKLHQGVIRKRAEYRFRRSFFGTFLDKQKSTDNQCEAFTNAPAPQ